MSYHNAASVRKAIAMSEWAKSKAIQKVLKKKERLLQQERKKRFDNGERLLSVVKRLGSLALDGPKFTDSQFIVKGNIDVAKFQTARAAWVADCKDLILAISQKECQGVYQFNENWYSRGSLFAFDKRRVKRA